MAKHVCPKCGGTEFIVTAHVTQDWKVDTDGDFLQCVQECVEVTHKPDNGDKWACAKCGYCREGSAFTYDEAGRRFLKGT